MSHAIHRLPRVHRMGSPHVHSRNRRRYPSILHLCHHNHCHSNRNQSFQLTSNTAWRNNQVRSSHVMSTGVHLPIHHRGPDWNRPSKFLTRHCPARHLLCSSPLPLRPIHRRSICNLGRVHPLIPPIYRVYPPLHLSQSPLRCNIRRCQPNLLPPTLPRPCRYASTILRLP